MSLLKVLSSILSGGCKQSAESWLFEFCTIIQKKFVEPNKIVQQLKSNKLYYIHQPCYLTACMCTEIH